MSSDSNEMSTDLVAANNSEEVISQENANGEAPQVQQPQPAQTSYFGIAKGLMVRAVIIYFISSFFSKSSSNNQATQNASGQPAVAVKGSANIYNNGTIMDVYFYLSEDELSVDFDQKNLVWHIPNVVYGDWYGGPNGDSSYTLDTTIDIPLNVQNNGSLWGHVFFVKSGMSPNPLDKGRYSYTHTVHKYKRLNRFKKRHFTKTHNLLTGETSASAEDIAKLQDKMKSVEILSHWHPNLTINIVDDHTPWTRGHVPPPLDEYIEFEPTTGKYFPIVYFNDYWNLLRDYTPINTTTKTLPISLTFQPLSLFRWQLYSAQAMRARWTSFLGQDLMQESDDEQDSLKEALLETSPYLLGLTFVISIVHSVFEFLAFKNDIQFWKNRKSLEGLSVRSVFFNVFQSLIVLLYILDNDTNMMVRISVFVGLLIEFWKIHKVLNIQIDREDKIFGLIPKVRFSEKSSYVDSPTKQYDMMAFRYLSWVLYPLLVAYAIYSMIYHEHKGWYSFVLSMLYGFLLTFGFIMMTPQLFINYKLKSVAHLPWRMLTYKFLNTFIDDIFAFVIKMPTMYRLGCFRDDIIFLIFLYQRWIYRVDLKRVNEFGYSGEKEGEEDVPQTSEVQNEQMAAISNGVSKPTDKKND